MNRVTNLAWVLVVAVALGISWWSLYAVARHYGVPVVPSAGVSTVFDGAALVAANIALSHAQKHGDSGTGARLAVLLLVLASAGLNGDHAAILHDSKIAYVLFGAPPVVSWLVFELQTRWIKRDALIAAGKVARPLPVFGHPVWLDHPYATYKARRQITRAHMEQATAAATYSIGQALGAVSSRADAIRLAAAATNSDDPALIVAWLTANRHYLPAEYQAIDQPFVARSLGQARRRASISPDSDAPPVSFSPDSAQLQGILAGQRPELEPARMNGNGHDRETSQG